MKEFIRHTIGDPAAAVVMFAGGFIFVFVVCLLYVLEEKDQGKRKDCVFQWITLDALFAVGVGLAVWTI